MDVRGQAAAANQRGTRLRRPISRLSFRHHVPHPTPLRGDQRALQTGPAGSLPGQYDAVRQQRAILKEEDAADMAPERAQPTALLRDLAAFR